MTESAASQELNPFSSLSLPTPEGLRADRAAAAALRTRGQGYWVQSASEYGLKVREAMNDAGRFLTPEDRRAQFTQGIMQNAQQAAERLIVEEGMDPLDAQESAVSQAMTDFMHEGDYQAAQAMLPSLNKIRSYKAELGKLKAEAYNENATGFKAESEGTVKLEQSPYEISKLIEQAGAESALATERYAKAKELEKLGNLHDRMPQPRAGAAGGGPRTLASEEAKFRETVAATRSVVTKLNDLSNVLTVAPWAAGKTAAGVNVIGQYLSGAQEFFKSQGMAVGGERGLSRDPNSGKTESTGGSISAYDIVRNNRGALAKSYHKAGGRSLGMDLAEYTSLVIDTAYALARANDPGGRLSDNDFNFALQTLGSISQDPASAKAAFAAVAERAYENVKFKREGFGKAKAMEMAPGLAGLDAQMEQFTKDWGGSKFRGANLEARKGGSGSSTSSSPAYTPAAEEFMKTYGPK